MPIPPLPTRRAPTLDLSRIYQPIAAEIEEVERRLQEQMASYEGVVGEMMGHVSRFAGKRMRPSLCVLTGKALGKVASAHFDVAVVAEMIHNATLVHDDVLDGAGVRRNIPSVHNQWGTEVSVLFGDYLFAKAFALCASIDDRDILLTMAETARVMCLGELLQNVHRGNFALTESEYLDIVGKKTAWLFGACAELGAVAAGGPRDAREAMREFGNAIGVAFQIVDDHLDLMGDEAEVGKTLGTDIEKGKVTLPLIALFGQLDEKRRRELHALLAAPGGDKRRAVVDLIDAHGLRDSALERAEGIVRDARAKLAVLPRNAYREALAALADYVVTRRQ